MQEQRTGRLATVVAATLSAYAALPGSSNAETVGAFEIGKCNKDNRCEALDSNTNQVIIDAWDNPMMVSKSELKTANKYYKQFAQADQILKKRGFTETARVVLLFGFGDETLVSDEKSLALDVYLRRVHKNSVKQVYDIPWDHTLETLQQFGTLGKAYHPNTGRKLSVQSIVAQAKSVPSCYAKGNPPRDCRPVRYDVHEGCWVPKEERANFASNEYRWKFDGLGDLPMLPSKAKSRIDLADAKRKKKPAKKLAVNKSDNPAKRISCFDPSLDEQHSMGRY